MKRLNSIIWFLIAFIIVTLIIAIISQIYGSGWLSILIGVNLVSSFVIVEMLKHSFNEDVKDYKKLYREKFEELDVEKKKLKETRILLSDHIEHKLKMRKVIQDSLNKGLVIIFFLGLISCKSYKEKLNLSRYVESYGVVDAINYTKGYFVVTWHCSEPPFKNQPCYATSDHLIKNFPEVSLGDTLDLYLRKSFKY